MSRDRIGKRDNYGNCKRDNGNSILNTKVLQVYTNKQMLVGVYLDPRRSSTPSKSAENGNYEAFVMVLYCHFINEVMF